MPSSLTGAGLLPHFHHKAAPSSTSCKDCWNNIWEALEKCRVEKTPVSWALIVLKEKENLHFFLQWLHKKPPSPLLWVSFFYSSVQSKLRSPHARPLQEFVSPSEDIKAIYELNPKLQPKLDFPSLVPAADSRSPQPHKVISHLKLFLWECQRTTPSTPTQHCFHPFPPSQLKNSHQETRDDKLSVPVTPLLRVGTAPTTSGLSRYSFIITTTQSWADGPQKTESYFLFTWKYPKPHANEGQIYLFIYSSEDFKFKESDSNSDNTQPACKIMRWVTAITLSLICDMQKLWI